MTADEAVKIIKKLTRRPLEYQEAFMFLITRQPLLDYRKPSDCSYEEVLKILEKIDY